MIDQLTPQAIFALILEERGHHLFITIKDARAPWMVFGKRAKQLSHSRRNPAIASAPIEWRVGRVKKKTIWLLQFVEVRGHCGSSPIEIFDVTRRPKGLHLDRRNHVHVIYSITRLAGNTVGRGLVPLFVSQALPHIQIFTFTCLHVNLERHHTEHSIIDMRLR